MRTEIIEPNGDLKRHVWVFNMSVDAARCDIRLMEYSFQTKETNRHKWKKQTNYDRLMKRDSNIDMPIIPLNIEKQVKEQICQRINELQII